MKILYKRNEELEFNVPRTKQPIELCFANIIREKTFSLPCIQELVSAATMKS